MSSITVTTNILIGQPPEDHVEERHQGTVTCNSHRRVVDTAEHCVAESNIYGHRCLWNVASVQLCQ